MTDLISLLDQIGIPYREGGTHQHVRHGWVGLQCPWCQTDVWHLGVPIGRTVAVCWRCGRHTLAETLRAITSEPWPVCIEWVRSLGYAATAPRMPLDAIERAPASITPPNDVGPLGAAHRRYLTSRGFDSDEVARVWGIRGIGPFGGRLAWRLWIPVFSDGRLVNWVSRSISNCDGRLRYVSAGPGSFSIPLKQTLFGQEFAPGPAVVVVEGPLDVLKVGFGSVAVYGTAFTEMQARMLQQYQRRVIAFDSEPKAQAAARKLARRLSGFPGETLVVQLDAADPGSASAEEISELTALAAGR